MPRESSWSVELMVGGEEALLSTGAQDAISQLATDLLLSAFGRLAAESRHFAGRPISLIATNARHCPG